MTELTPERFDRAFDAAEPCERREECFELTTTEFGGRVDVRDSREWELEYGLEIRVPTLDAATEGAVGPAVQQGWFDTLALRVEDAPGAVLHDVELSGLEVERSGETVLVEFRFRWGNAEQVPAIAKAMAEFVEGTFVEGIVPGYDYGPEVSGLLSAARSSGGDEEGGGDPMPL